MCNPSLVLSSRYIPQSIDTQLRIHRTQYSIDRSLLITMGFGAYRTERLNKPMWPEEISKHAWEHVTGKVIARTYPTGSQVRGDISRVLLPLFLSTLAGGRARIDPRFFLLAVIFHHGQERRSPLKRLNSLDSVGGEEGGGTGSSYPHCRIAIFLSHPPYFTPLIPSP